MLLVEVLAVVVLVAALCGSNSRSSSSCPEILVVEGFFLAVAVVVVAVAVVVVVVLVVVVVVVVLVAVVVVIVIVVVVAMAPQDLLVCRLAPEP